MKSTWVMTCSNLRTDLIWFAEAFLWIALIIAVVGTLADLALRLAPLFTKPTFPATRAGITADPVKFLDALKNLIDALTKAPAWITMFLAAVALIWAVFHLVPGNCVAP